MDYLIRIVDELASEWVAGVIGGVAIVLIRLGCDTPETMREIAQVLAGRLAAA